MPTRLLTGDVWKTITSLTRRSKRADVAVAWCASSVGKLLPLKPGSLLVTDLTEAAVMGCRTRPKELLPLARRDVAIHNLRNLHAKIFVFDNAAIIGSTNVSTLSSSKLVEAAVLITGDRKLIAAARRFVRGLAGDRVGEDELLRLDTLWDPQNLQGAPRSGRKPVPPVGVIERDPLWVVPLKLDKWPADMEHADKVARPLARKKMKNRLNHLAAFSWDGSEFGDQLAVGQQLLQVVKNEKAAMVDPPGRVTHIKYLRKKTGSPRFIVYVEEPRGMKRKNLKRYVAQLGRHGREVKSLAAGRRPRFIKASPVIQSILQAWPIN